MAKSAEAFRTISEAADELGVAQHVLRFWESRFSFIKPMKRAGGRRFYRPADIALLEAVRRLLHHEGYTIKGVQKLYRETGLKQRSIETPAPDAEFAQTLSNGGLASVVADLEVAKARLDAALGRM